MIGASAGTYLICNIVFGIESAATSLLWCALIAGGIGAGAGSNYASKQGRAGGEFFYKELENEQ